MASPVGRGLRLDQIGVGTWFTPKARLDFFSDPLAVLVGVVAERLIALGKGTHG
jgi:hypothetical protein